jgi:4-hydroxy-tetrahydrodipicolinate reductase
MSLKILLSGAKGRMGQAICSIAADHGCEITHPVDLGDDPAGLIADCDLVIDFSLRDATRPLAELAAEHGKPMVIGTTGHDADDREAIEKTTSRIPMVWAGNFSTGVNLLFYLTQQAARVLDTQSGFDPEVIEMHHRLKKDAPSGTADRLLEILKDSRKLGEDDVSHGRSGMVGERKEDEIGSHALRGGDVVGEHTVMFAGIGERIELTHRATDRTIFAAGALKAAKWAVNQEPGLYSMQDVLGLQA